MTTLTSGTHKNHTNELIYKAKIDSQAHTKKFMVTKKDSRTQRREIN